MIAVDLIKAGRVKYLSGLKLQQHFVNVVKSNREVKRSKSFLLLLDHDPVYTVGIRDRKLYGADKEKLQKLGAEYFETNRGGLITFHGPRQLVAYPILDLRDFFQYDSIKLKTHKIPVNSKYRIQPISVAFLDRIRRCTFFSLE